MLSGACCLSTLRLHLAQTSRGCLLSNPAAASFPCTLDITSSCADCAATGAGGSYIAVLEVTYGLRVPLWRNSTEAYYKTTALNILCVDDDTSDSSIFSLEAGSDALWPSQYDTDMGAVGIDGGAGLTALSVA